MSEYIKTVWKDHVVDEDTQEIIQQGTPISAKNLNNMENGIENAAIQMSEIFPDNEIIDISHNLKCCPMVRVISSQNGLGLGALGTAPLGGEEIQSIKCVTKFIDLDNIKILVPKKYFLNNPHLQLVTETQYILTFSNSVMSLLIDLIKI